MTPSPDLLTAGSLPPAPAPLVSLQAQASYEPESLARAVDALLAPLGGLGAFVRPGDRVVLKPNLLLGFPPERAITTHPAVVRAVAQHALDCGARVAIGDSPGLGSIERVGRACGIDAVVRDLGLAWVEFTPLEVVDDRRVFKRLSIARELLEADVVINLPKLKTHCQMLMTLAVKNMFGAVVGLQKLQWHYRAGRDKHIFARMLYEICMAVHPALHIVDAVVGMDGNGPRSGTPRAAGFVAAGTDPSAVDAILCDIVGVPREDLYTLQAARAAGDRAWEHARTAGADPADLRPAHWTLAETQTLAMQGPAFLQRLPWIGRWLRDRVTAIPYALPDRCVRCGECVRICPAHAMRMEPAGVTIDPARCIRCYCCHELCTHDAMGLRRSSILRLFG